MKGIKISESQNKLIQQFILEELQSNTLQDKKDDVVVSKEIQSPGTSLSQNLIDTANAAKNNGINIKDKDVSLQVTGDVPGIGTSTIKVNPSNESTNETVLITKRQVNEVRLRKLKKNTTIISVENFLNR